MTVPRCWAWVWPWRQEGLGGWGGAGKRPDTLRLPALSLQAAQICFTINLRRRRHHPSVFWDLPTAGPRRHPPSPHPPGQATHPHRPTPSQPSRQPSSLPLTPLLLLQGHCACTLSLTPPPTHTHTVNNSGSKEAAACPALLCARTAHLSAATRPHRPGWSQSEGEHDATPPRPRGSWAAPAEQEGGDQRACVGASLPTPSQPRGAGRQPTVTAGGCPFSSHHGPPRAPP